MEEEEEDQLKPKPSGQDEKKVLPQYTKNLQRIFQQESNFKFQLLGSYDEDKELLSPEESETEEDADESEDAGIDEPEAVHRRVYKEVEKRKDSDCKGGGSPDSREFCPNSWFQVDRPANDPGFCRQLSWKCCFLFLCLPLCYPCYLSRTVRLVL